MWPARGGQGEGWVQICRKFLAGIFSKWNVIVLGSEALEVFCDTGDNGRALWRRPCS